MKKRENHIMSKLAEQLLAEPINAESEAEAMAALTGVINLDTARQGLTKAMRGSSGGSARWSVALTEKQHALNGHPAIQSRMAAMAAEHGINVSFVAQPSFAVLFAVAGR
jgi:hypothetical protein